VTVVVVLSGKVAVTDHSAIGVAVVVVDVVEVGWVVVEAGLATCVVELVPAVDVVEVG